MLMDRECNGEETPVREYSEKMCRPLKRGVIWLLLQRYFFFDLESKLERGKKSVFSFWGEIFLGELVTERQE